VVRVSLIINPVASSVTRRARVVIQKALAADHDLSVYETSRHGQGVRLARRAARSGADVVVALGGDGTINEAANGLLGESCAVVPLPGGSTNVFARALGYPNDAIEATGVLLEALTARNIVPAGVGMANERAFLFNLGAGFDAAVVARVERRGQLKRWFGHPYFIYSTLATLFSGIDHGTAWFSVETDSGHSVKRAQQVSAINTTPYTFLGSTPLHLTPEATIHTPLSMMALTKLSPGVLVRLVHALRSEDGLAESKNTRHWSNIHQATITGFRPFPYQVDGEIIDPVDDLQISYRPDAINLVLPVRGGH